ncbi:MAG: TetR/AcrR family transcriptional regulator [Rhodospirillaceae bacterium]|jgi:TetR/AcrR family transcriptional repressor of nem operon|nr:TetR/AcrR family transcriptional regulator [Rhodospirillaceae bacterium]MBT4043112.1 TetR/AcrR family transcriptional regulator [Rhodospirillaceae bacterium]MBT4688110.1 TetR/AcrR family transcriptional regulator [Rhodospirillaceae bacterium]MBT5080277.1 TetR/AcrR family transcriptional regulator [Rhodospirillaceae bacterium]MBT5525024.1 TetR/AcrR family transcriptional regulator [Rhodospirillaceae bacterium]
MKVSKKQAAENRASIVDAAERLFRERGFEGVSIPEITKAAGLTHGGFYKSFGSKNALAAEACEKSFDHANNWLASTKSSDNGLAEYFKNYLSVRHRDDSRGGCPMAALATDIHRQCDDVQKAFSLGVDSYLTNLEDSLSSASGKSRPAQEGSMAALTMIVGAMALSRATKRCNKPLSDKILRQTRLNLEKLDGSIERV